MDEPLTLFKQLGGSVVACGQIIQGLQGLLVNAQPVLQLCQLNVEENKDRRYQAYGNSVVRCHESDPIARNERSSMCSRSVFSGSWRFVRHRLAVSFSS